MKKGDTKAENSNVIEWNMKDFVLRKTYFCTVCGERIVTGKKCKWCKSSFLLQEDYEKIFKAAKSIMSVLFEMEIDFHVDIIVENKDIGKMIKRKGSVFRCNPYVQVPAAIGGMIRELVICWIERKYSSSDWVTKADLNDESSTDNSGNGVDKFKLNCGKRSVKRALGDWYELYFMKEYKYYDYIEGKKYYLSNKMLEEGRIFQKLVEEYKLEGPKKPLDNVNNDKKDTNAKEQKAEDTGSKNKLEANMQTDPVKI